MRDHIKVSVVWHHMIVQPIRVVLVRVVVVPIPIGIVLVRVVVVPIVVLVLIRAVIAVSANLNSYLSVGLIGERKCA